MAIDERTGFAPQSAGEALGALLDDVRCSEVDTNRYAARQAERLADAVEFTRRHPEIYTIDADAEMAERAVMLELSLRLRLSQERVRELCSATETARRDLPLLWQRARDGFASMYSVSVVVAASGPLAAPMGAPQEVLDAEAEALALLDRSAQDWVIDCSVAQLRHKAKKLVDRITGDSAARRHTRAMADRKVIRASAGDGMSWITALLPTHEAVAAMRRLTATAKHTQKDEREERTRDQIRADLFSAWLRGVGTATAVKTKVFVTVPVQLLAGDPVPVEQATIVGGDTLDAITAKQLFLDARGFHRVITDPVKGVIVDMDRRTYRPTAAQRDWLVLQHGTCSRDGCMRLAVDADLDHDRPWSQGGTTDIRQLRPLCPRDHKLRHRTRIRYRTRPGRSVQVVSPTGFESTAPPPF
ncbi:HNH endonuclease [Microbacterium sp. ARD32]|uniref:HNH endonuclease signature motif containing protein n=1 Tax=Microbacterium sp. ARD32 TaxID=2962577 RepID=UPI0028810CB5|nr:HNH endonuclease [Microbacterium sp. ARD32]MDT0157196.1 HNH endonuclease [Microbacterium sp. ARD32]